MTFSGGGLPIKIRRATEAVAQPKASWVKDEGIPVSYHTRGYVSGSAGRFALTSRRGALYAVDYRRFFAASGGGEESNRQVPSRHGEKEAGAKELSWQIEAIARWGVHFMLAGFR